MRVALNPSDVYDVLHCAYRNGVLEKFMAIQGEALEAVLQEGGYDMGDLLNRMDEAREETVTKIDRILERLGPFIKYASNDRLMRFSSRLLEMQAVKTFLVRRMKDGILKTMTGHAPPSLLERLKAVLGRTA
jgi:hypothetical protein